MKTVTTLFATILLVSALQAQDIRINEVSPEGDWIELYNTTAGAIDVSTWYLCAKFSYTRLDNTPFNGPPISIISGSLNIPAGGYLVVSWDIDVTGSDVGLYTSTSFASAAAMVDFLQYNFSGIGGRESVAVDKGIWTATETLALPPAGKTLSYFGPGTGAAAWDSSEPTQGADNAALPVELASFDALLVDGDVNLLWTTASEINNLGFEVQMQLQNNASFETLAFVEAGPDGSGIQNYSYNAGSVMPGKHRFRLRQIDIGGAKKYSDTIELSVDVSGSFELAQAYPNPFSSYAEFDVAVAREQDVVIELVDISGRIVRTLFAGRMSGGDNHRIRLSGDRLPSGTYFYRATGENFTATRSVVLVSEKID